MHNRKVRWAGLLLIVSLSWSGITTLQAEPVEKTITMDEAVDMALKNNFSVGIEDINLKTKIRQRDLAWNYFLPTIEASGTMYKTNEVIPPLPPYSSGLPDRFTLQAGLNITLPLSAKMVYGIRQTFLDYEAGTISLDTAKKKLELDVRKNFLNLILLQENIKLTKKNIENASTRYEQARTNYRNGLVDEYTMLAAQVALESLKPVQMDTENAYTNVMLVFKMTIGAKLEDEIKLNGTIEPTIIKLDEQKLLTEALVNNPDVLALNATTKTLENAKGATTADFFPYAAFSLSFDPSFSRDPFKDAWFANLDNDWSQKTGAFAFKIIVPLQNLIPGSKTWQTIHDTEDKIAQNDLRMKQLLQKTEMDVRLAVLKLKKSAEAIHSYQLSLNLAEKANAMGQQAYKAGLKDYSQIEDTELQLNKAQVDLLREKFNYATGLLDLNYTINTSLDKVKE